MKIAVSISEQNLTSTSEQILPSSFFSDAYDVNVSLLLVFFSNAYPVNEFFTFLNVNYDFFFQITLEKDVVTSSVLTINILNANTVIIKKDAFNTGILSLSLENISLLILEPGAISPIQELLLLTNVHMEECPEYSFGSQIKTFFKNISITNAQANCINGSRFNEFSISSSKINTIKSKAFSGEMKNMEIIDSDFLIIEENGINLKIENSFKIKNFFSRKFESNALSILSNNEIKVEKLKVILMERNAIKNMLIKKTPSGFCPPMSFHGIDITEAKPGSLAFSKCSDIALTDLSVDSVNFENSENCPSTEKLTRIITDTPDYELLDSTQEPIFWNLYEKSTCDKDSHLTFPDFIDTCRLCTEDDMLDIRCDIGDVLSCISRTTSYRSTHPTTSSVATSYRSTHPTTSSTPLNVVKSESKYVTRGLVIDVICGLVIGLAVVFVAVVSISIRRYYSNKKINYFSLLV